jgi:hypothetical protein
MSIEEKLYYYTRLRNILRVHYKIVEDNTKLTEEEKEEHLDLVNELYDVVEKKMVKKK